MNRTLGRIVGILGASLLAGCAAVLASNEPLRNGLIGRVQHGMTQEQVLGVMGPPDRTTAFPRTQTVAWDYRYTDSWGYLAMFAVTFSADGRVLSTFTWRPFDGRGGKA